ncbi:MAG: glycosyltransferase [Flaviramulus sp.]|nr:glycosyltransferase [Flaviramulus sp.]
MRVLQLIDTLEPGGAERVAVNIANVLSNKIDGSFLCATRKEGALKSDITQLVGYLFLGKTKTIDFKAISRLNMFVKEKEINIIHAHSSSFFLATIIKLLNKNVYIIWHDHYGNSTFLENRKYQVLKCCSKVFTHIFSVNRTLALWAKKTLEFDNVSYVSNFATLNTSLSSTTLKGKTGMRIICLANLRPQKDHFTLLEAFKQVHNLYPDWTLHCVGKSFKDGYSNSVLNKIKDLNLEASIFLYDSKPDIYHILKQSDIGVLSSKSEGLPIALLEYGLAKLAVLATDVGDNGTVITNQINGFLVNASSPKELSEAIILYIENKELRLTFAKKFNQHIKENYSETSQIQTILETYKVYTKKY